MTNALPFHVTNLTGRYYLGGDCSLGRQDCCGKHCDVDAMVQPEFELQTLLSRSAFRAMNY